MIISCSFSSTRFCIKILARTAIKILARTIKILARQYLSDNDRRKSLISDHNVKNFQLHEKKISYLG